LQSGIQSTSAPFSVTYAKVSGYGYGSWKVSSRGPKLDFESWRLISEI
jgi:hypothetical protein